MDQDYKHILEQANGVFYLQGLFFIKDAAIRKNDDIVKKTFQDLYKSVSFN